MNERYECQMRLPDIGKQGQQKLHHSKVLCVGAGGLGSAALPYLVSAGIGTIGICDPDRVSLSNLHRQVLYRETDLNQLKSSTAILHLKNLNSAVNFHNLKTKLNPENVLDYISAYDYILDCTDNFSTKLLLNDACHTLQKPLVSAAVQQYQGQCSVFWSPGPCLRCLYADLEKAKEPSCEQGGILGMVVGVMGLLQAFEMIKLCLGLTNTLVGKLWIWDFMRGIPQIFEYFVSPDCDLCTGKTNFATLWPMVKDQLPSLENIFLLDVRQPHEHQAFNIGGVLIPLAELPHRLDEIPNDKPIVVYCRSGCRSQTAVELLQSAGFKDCKNLSGGMLAWQQDILKNKD